MVFLFFFVRLTWLPPLSVVPLVPPDVLVCHDGGGEDLLHVVGGGAPPQVDLGGGGGVRVHGVKVGADGKALERAV